METLESCKFTLCVLLTQFGKTFAAIERIKTELKQDEEQGQSIHLVFTMNTLLNNKQFANRLEPIEDTYGKGSVCVMSSERNKYTGRYAHVSNRIELQSMMFENKRPRVIIMCSNSTRFDDGVQFLKSINGNEIYSKYRSYVYFDELHEYISDDSRKQIEEIHALESVKGIIALTATPEKIFKKPGGGFWSKIRMIYLDEFNQRSYAGHRDMIFNEVNDFFPSPYIRPGIFNHDQLEKETIGFISHVLKRFPSILGDRTRTFIPAHKRRLSHNKVQELILEIKPNAVVVIINGVDKIIRYNDNGHMKTLSIISDNEEVCETIATQILCHNLQDRPLVITGLLCIAMGQTLTHKKLGSFTSAIFGHMDLDNEDIYQLFGRITGRMKDWDNYVKTEVYCPTKVRQCCSVMEECNRNMAVFHNGDIVEHSDYIAPMLEMGVEGQAALDNIRKKKEKKHKKLKIELDESKYDWAGKGSSAEYELFETLETASARKKEILSSQKKSQAVKLNKKTDADGFHLCSVAQKKKLYLRDISSLGKTSNLAKNHGKILDMGVGVVELRAYVFYEETEIDPEKYKVALRWIKRIDEA